MENNTVLKPDPLTVTSEKLRSEANALAKELAPRRFAVFAINELEQDGVILAWGQYFDDERVVLTGEAVSVHGRFGSLRTALGMCRAGGACIHVAWVDPEPDE